MISCNIGDYLTELLPVCFGILSDGNAMLEAQIVTLRILHVTVLLYRRHAQSVLPHIADVVVSGYSAFPSLRSMDEETGSSLLIVLFECMEAISTQFGFEVFWGFFGGVIRSVLADLSTIEISQKQAACVARLMAQIKSAEVTG
jgi:hypothetical protein